MTFIYCFFQNKTTGKCKNIGMYMTTIWLSPFHLNLYGHCCKPQLPSEFDLHIQHFSYPFYISAKVAWNCYAKLHILGSTGIVSLIIAIANFCKNVGSARITARINQEVPQFEEDEKGISRSEGRSKNRNSRRHGRRSLN